MHLGVVCDDCFVDCHNPEALDYIEQKITAKYGGCMRTNGDILPFVGMLFNFRQHGVVKVDMPKFVDSFGRQIGHARRYTRRIGLIHRFGLRRIAGQIGAGGHFHSRVAKLLYLAKRTRPDILLSINFLCTRVLQPTVQDWKKLIRVYRYLLGTKGLCIYLQADDNKCVRGHYDASYGVHSDMKSHTVACTTLGKGSVYVSSCKQTIVAKSSTEAEMIAMLGSLSLKTNSIFISVDQINRQYSIKITRARSEYYAMVKVRRTEQNILRSATSG
jgi:hypothetical protein